MTKVKGYINDNIVALALVIVFIPIFILTEMNDTVVNYIGTTSVEYLNNEFYR